MPPRIVPLVNGEFYHVLNRGVNRADIFITPRDHKRFLQAAFYYQFLGPKPKFSNFSKTDVNLLTPLSRGKIVEIVCYSLMPNHIHFLLRQLKDNGISIFMQQLTNSFAKYFNTKYTRSGPLFQNRYKAILVESDEQLLHLSRYIHLNPVVSHVVHDIKDYKWSSYEEYIDNKPRLCEKSHIMNFFDSGEKYKAFLEDQISYGESLEYLKHHTIED